MMVVFFRSLPNFGGPYVFSTNLGESPFDGFSRAKARLDEKAKVPNFTVKDLRETGATIMRRELGVPDHVVGMILNHAPATVTTRHYAGQHDPVAKKSDLPPGTLPVVKLVLPGIGAHPLLSPC